METIINYLDNMFATLPQTKQMTSLKEELMINMEEKYHELKQSGKSENEAIGIVISEFGNIDELISEFGIEPAQEKEPVRVLNEGDVYGFLEINKESGFRIGVGVFLCILAPAMLILFSQLYTDGWIPGVSEEMGDVAGLVPFFLLVATGVGIFIYDGMKKEKYKYMEKDFELPFQLRKAVERKNNDFQPTYTLSVIVGVVLCILSPVILIISSAFNEDASAYGVVALLLMVAAAVYIFIYFGSIKDSYRKVLKVEGFSKEKKKEKTEENRIIGAISAIIWPLAICIFLISGFIFQQWHINWIIFPITALLSAMFFGAYSNLKEKH